MSFGMLPSRGDYVRKAIIQFIFVILVLIAIYPLLWMILTSFKTQEDYLTNKYNLPWPIMLRNLIAAFRGGRFARWFLNSVIVTFGATCLTTLLACFSAYAFARMPFRGSNTILNIIIALMVVPPVVMIVPLFILYNQFNLHSTYHGIIILYTGITQPFSVYLLTNFFKTIPKDMVEAAMIDGCSKVGILFRIFIPLSRAALVTLFITQAVWIWNELLIALIFLAKDEMRTLMVGITAFRTKYMLDVPVIMAGLLMSTLPMLILYALFQKAFIRGLTEGSVKG
jgi:ABC-type glycerol-3-phosphate transport system permease component